MLRGVAIKRKLMLTMMITSILALVVACLGLLAYEFFAIRRAMVRDLDTLARIIADNVNFALGFEQADDARAVLGSLRANRNITYACVLTPNRGVFADYQRDELPPPPLPPENSPGGHVFARGGLEVTRPIIHKGERIGLLLIRSDLGELHARLTSYPSIMAVLAAFSAGLALLLSTPLQRLISRPILHLAEITRKVTREGDYSLRATSGTGDEVGELIDGFNHMLAQIEEQNDRLTRARAELEQRVVERTRALQDEIRERERAQEAVLMSEAKVRSLVESANDAIVLADEHGHIVLWNQGARGIFGYTEQEALGQPITLLMPPDFRDPHRRGFEHYLRSRENKVIGRTVELSGQRKDGTVFPIDLSLSTWTTTSGHIFFSGIIRDTTERKETYEKLQHFAAQLERSNQELQAFAYVASHDLQEPLRKVQAFGDRLKARCGEVLTAEGKDYLERMQNAANRMQNLINDLLLFSRVSTQEQPFERVDLNRVVREVLSDLEIRIQQTKGAIEIGPLPVVDADPLQMRQLFQNLLSNGLKFHRPEEPPVLRVSALIPSGVAGPESCDILVADNGIGFEEKYLDRIFAVFQRLHGRTAYEGTGIGLAICRKITERHGGRITARSTPGQGATFVVTLPLPSGATNKQ